MKEFVKIGNKLIRTSTINDVNFDDMDLTIDINGVFSTIFGKQEEYFSARDHVEKILLETEPEPANQKPEDYDLVLTYFHRIFDYYGRSVGDEISSNKMLRASWHINDLDCGRYRSLKIIKEVAIKYGILYRSTLQSCRLEV